MALLVNSASEVGVGQLAYNCGGSFTSVANELVSGSWRSRFIGRCAVCGRWYGSDRRDKKTCSSACRMKLSRQTKDADYGKDRSRKMVATKVSKVSRKTCECCGRDFSVTALNSSKIYCSDACKQRVYRARKAAGQVNRHRVDSVRAVGSRLVWAASYQRVYRAPDVMYPVYREFYNLLLRYASRYDADITSYQLHKDTGYSLPDVVVYLTDLCNVGVIVRGSNGYRLRTR